jgi:hypothetical protein
LFSVHEENQDVPHIPQPEKQSKLKKMKIENNRPDKNARGKDKSDESICRGSSIMKKDR